MSVSAITIEPTAHGPRVTLPDSLPSDRAVLLLVEACEMVAAGCYPGRMIGPPAPLWLLAASRNIKPLRC